MLLLGHIWLYYRDYELWRLNLRLLQAKYALSPLSLWFLVYILTDREEFKVSSDNRLLVGRWVRGQRHLLFMHNFSLILSPTYLGTQN